MWSTQKHHLANKSICLAIGFALVSTVAGCNSIMHGKAGRNDKDPWYKMSFFGSPKYQTPKSMAAIWSHDVMVAKGAQPTRGFGGRIYFYNERSQAIPVEGELIVYGYDETVQKAATVDSSKADKRFRFTKEQFTTHFSETDLGASYSVWIPWDIDGNPRKKILLLPTFVSESGEIVRGQMSTLFLPGPENESTLLGDQRSQILPHSAVRTASAVTPVNSTAHGSNTRRSESKGLMKTTTINVPSRSSISRPLKQRSPVSNQSGNQRLIGRPITPRSSTSPSTIPSSTAFGSSSNPSIQRLLPQTSTSIPAAPFNTTTNAQAGQIPSQPSATQPNAFANAAPNAFAATPFLQPQLPGSNQPRSASSNQIGTQAVQLQSQYGSTLSAPVTPASANLPTTTGNQFQWPAPQYPNRQIGR